MSQTELNNFNTAISDHFDTFSALHSITVIKEPQKTIIQNNADVYAGFGNSSNLDNIIYVPVSGIFPCMVFSKGDDFPNVLMMQIQARIQHASKIIKVKEDARAFLEGPQVEQVILDNKETLTLGSKGFVKNYGNISYYYFIMNKTP